MALRWTDDHCHLGWDADDTPDLGVADELVAEARAAGVDPERALRHAVRREVDAAADRTQPDHRP